MKNYLAKNKIIVAGVIAILIVGIVLVGVYIGKVSAETDKINAVASVMLTERDTDSSIQFQGDANETEVGPGKYALHDDLFEYVFDSSGFILTAARSSDKTSDIFSATSENQEDLETRALNLHKRNFGQLLQGDNSIIETQNPIGTTTFEIRETLNGNPTGRMTYVTFSKGKALISLVAVNQPVSDANLALEDKISNEKAAEIAFADISEQYGDVLADKDFAKVQWVAVKEAFEQRLVWTVTFTELTRLDLDLAGENWGAQIRVDVQTGEILERAYQ